MLEEKVKQMLEQKSLSGGNNQITTKQLKAIMNMASEEADTTDAESQQMLSHSSEEEL